jgi:outer membrane protein assembly factor BamB
MRSLGAVTVTVMVTGLALAGCGSPAPHDRCTSDAQCAAGQYCAAGGVCWADSVAPVIDSALVTCPSPCLRDSTVAVQVTAHDDARLAAVTVRLDLAPGLAVPLTLQGGAWRGSLALGDWPFPAFERTVEATVEARDGAGNKVTAARTFGPATRLRWAVEFAPGEVAVPGAVAVDAQGTAVFGGSNAKVHFIGLDGLPKRSPVAVGNGLLTAPVVVGPDSLGNDGVWVPSDDGKVYRVTVPAVAAEPVVVGVVCDTGAAVKGLALLNVGTPIASSSMGVFMAIATGTCRSTAVYPGTVAFPGVTSGATYFGAEARNLHSIALNPQGFIVENWSPAASLGSDLAAPLAIRSATELLALTNLGTSGALVSVSPTGVPTTLATTGVPADGPAVRPNGDVLVPEKEKALSCWSSAGLLRWRHATFTGVPLTPLLLAGDDAVVVADGRGSLTALDAAGQVRWSTQLAPVATPLHPLNLHAPAGATRSTGYVPAANGLLYAVILDGRLDATAPWPKAFHDPRNTGNASTPLP